MEKLRIGVIGAGGIADRRAIPGLLLSPRLELAAVMDADENACRRLSEKYGVPAYVKEAPILEDPSIEAVYIASPVFCHYEQVLAAARAGKHILCEKPFALDPASAREMAEFCASRGVVLRAGFMMRFHNLHQRMRELVLGGQLGQLVHASAQFSCWYPDNGSWRQLKSKSGGGPLMDMAVHSLDLLSHITGERFGSVSALTRTQVFGYEVEDSASLLLEFEKGAGALVSSHFCVPDEAQVSRLELYGTKGRLTAENTLGQVQSGRLTGVLLTGEGTVAVDERGDESGNMYQRQFESFFDVLRGGEGLNTGAEEMVYIQRLADAAYLSGRTGRREAVSG